jgi:hypothetical protein
VSGRAVQRVTGGMDLRDTIDRNCTDHGCSAHEISSIGPAVCGLLMMYEEVHRASD